MDDLQNRGAKANLSAEKMLTIIEYLAAQKEPARLLDMSKALGINVSTVSRFVTTLVNCGYAAQEEETARYYLTFKICAVANMVSAHTDIRNIARPYMRELTDMFNESACLAVEENMKVVYIEVMEGPGQMLRSMQRIGNVAPMHCTGIGKLLLLNYSDGELDRLIEVEGLTRYTEYTLTSKVQLVNELKRIREKGYAFDNEECEVGARCVAFPIYGAQGKIIAGISVTGPTNRLTDEFINSRLSYFDEIARDISYKMGYMAVK